MNNRLVNPITNAVISLPEKGWITRSAKSTVWKVKRVLVFKRPSSWGSDAELGDDVVVVLIYNWFDWFERRYISRRTRSMARNAQFINHGQFFNRILSMGERIGGGVVDVVCFQDSVCGVGKNGNPSCFLNVRTTTVDPHFNF